MKILFFSDIHGNGAAFDAFLQKAAEIPHELKVFCGDVFGYYYDQKYIIDVFRKTDNLICLRGNHDQYFIDLLDGKRDVDSLASAFGNSYRYALKTIGDENIRFIRNWPVSWHYNGDQRALGAFHGMPEDPLNGRFYPDSVAKTGEFSPFTHVVMGHTHHRMKKNSGSTLLLNPGSLGQPRDGKGSSFLFFDTSDGSHSWHIIKYNRENLRKRILENDPDKERFVEVLYRK